MLGMKYPQPKPSAESATAQLRPDSYGSRAPPPTSEQLCPDSYGSRAPPRHQSSSARTPTGARPRSQYQLLVSSVQTPVGAGLHL